MKYELYVTAKDGGEATVTGSASAIDAITAALEAAGARFNEGVGTWDFGFYSDTPKADPTA